MKYVRLIKPFDIEANGCYLHIDEGEDGVLLSDEDCAEYPGTWSVALGEHCVRPVHGRIPADILEIFEEED